MELTIQDFKDVLFELWLAQRENAALRASLSQREAAKPAPQES